MGFPPLPEGEGFPARRVMILVTGHAGFVGSNLLNRFKKEGFPVQGLEKTGKYFEWCTQLFALSEVHELEGIIHCGAISDNQYKNVDIFDWNSYAVRVLADLCRRQGIRLIYISSQTARDPKTLYGHSKKMAELLIKATPELDVCILQPFNIFGDEFMKPPHRQSLPYRLISHNLEVLWDTERDYVHVDDVVEAVMHAWQYRIAGTYHVGTGHATKSGTIAERISWKEYRREPTPEDIEKWTCADRTRFLPSWQPTISILDKVAKDG